MESLRTELSRCRDEFILEHFRKFDSPEFPPSWKTLEVASFGTLSKLYNNMNDFNVMKRVARDFDMPQHEYLHSWLGERTAMAIDTIIQDGRGWETAHPRPI